MFLKKSFNPNFSSQNVHVNLLWANKSNNFWAVALSSIVRYFKSFWPLFHIHWNIRWFIHCIVYDNLLLPAYILHLLMWGSSIRLFLPFPLCLSASSTFFQKVFVSTVSTYSVDLCTSPFPFFFPFPRTSVLPRSFASFSLHFHSARFCVLQIQLPRWVLPGWG